MRTYSELIDLPTFEERFRYLQLSGEVGVDTFGFDRFLNQVLYRSKEWKSVRDKVLVRDGCCDLAVQDRVIFSRPIVHHMNPMSVEDIKNHSGLLMDPEYLITVSHNTHNAIHYGDEGLLVPTLVNVRTKNDTCPW